MKHTDLAIGQKILRAVYSEDGSKLVPTIVEKITPKSLYHSWVDGTYTSRTRSGHRLYLYNEGVMEELDEIYRKIRELRDSQHSLWANLEQVIIE